MNDYPQLAHRTRNTEYQKTTSNNETNKSNNSNSNATSAKNKIVSKNNQESNSSGDDDKERKNTSKRKNHSSNLDSTLKKKNYLDRANNDDEESENEAPRIISRNQNQYNNSITRHSQKNNENFKSNINTNNDNKEADKSNLPSTSANRRNKSVNQHPKHSGSSSELNKFKDSENNNNNNNNNNDREKGRERSESGHHRSSSDASKHKISDNLAATTNFVTNENKSNRKLTQSLIKPLIPEESDSPPPQRRKNNNNNSNNSNNNNDNSNSAKNKKNNIMKKRYRENESVVLQCSLKPVIVEHYFVENSPQPFSGHLISKCNGRTIKSNMKHEEALQYVREIIPGPTYQRDNYQNQYTNRKQDKSASMTNSTSNSNLKLGKATSSSNRFTTSTSSLISQNSEQVDADKDKKPKRSKSVSQKADVLVQNLFNEDDPVSYFDFDFATVYTNSATDETTDELLPIINSFPSVKKLASLQINYDGDPKMVIYKLVSPFQSEDQPDQQDFLNLTKTASTNVKKGEIVLTTVRRNRLIESISSSAFTEFRFGLETNEFATDRIHIFTWHNLGIPTSLISKNLILVFQNYRGPGSGSGAQNLETLIKAITQYIVIWVRYFPKDFDDYSTCADFVLQLLKNMATKCRSCISFINVVGLLISDIYNKTIAPEDVYTPLKEPIYKDIAPVNYLINLSLDPYVVAQHFAYIDLCLLHKLQRSEFVNNNWMKVQEQMNKNINLNGNLIVNDSESQVNNFQVFLQRFNDTASFIAASILIETEKRRARNISYWIKMMYYARKVHNYHLLAIIDAGLSCLPVKRLKNSWRLVNDNALLAFNRLHNFFKNDQNQREMLADPKNSIPFIGIFLSQLASIDIDSTKVLMKDYTAQNDNSNDPSQNVRAYNLNVQRKCFHIIDQIFDPWGIEIEFELDEKILKECKKLTGKAKHPKDLIMPSISFEPLRNDETEVFSDFLPRK